MSRGWAELIGLSMDEARPVTLDLLVGDGVWWALGISEASIPPAPIFVVVDDGFDDAADYAPRAVVFWAADVERGRAWRPKGPPTCSASLSKREWNLVSALAEPDLWGAGVAAVIGRGLVGFELGVGPDGKAGWMYSSVTITDLEWLSGPEWSADRVEDWPPEARPT